MLTLYLRNIEQWNVLTNYELAHNKGQSQERKDTNKTVEDQQSKLVSKLKAIQYKYHILL
jgi:hypothetical protein